MDDSEKLKVVLHYINTELPKIKGSIGYGSAEYHAGRQRELKAIKEMLK